MSRSTKRKSDPRLSEVARELVIPAGIVSSEWPRVRDTLGNLGIEFDRWQQGLTRVALGKRKDGTYAATVGGVVLSIPRQVGKTFVIGAIIFALCLLRPGIKVIWTAHHTNTSDETFEAMQEMAKRAKIKPHIRSITTGNGKQRIRFVNRSQIEFGARESGFGIGKTKISILVMDEFQRVSESALDNFIPTMNQGENPLFFAMGTPPRPDDRGEAFRNKRRRALAGQSDDTLYVEFGADPGASPDDRKQWAKANPSYPKRTPETAMLRMRENLQTDESFLREALGIWDEDNLAPALIRPSWWLNTNVPRLPDGGVNSFGVRFSADGARIALAAAVKYDDESPIGVELIESASTLDGWQWVVDFLADEDRVARTSMIVVDGKGEVAEFIRGLRLAGVPMAAINFGKGVMSAPQAGDAYAGFAGAARDKKILHIEQDDLTASVSGSQRRDIGTQGAFGFKPIRPMDDSSPVEAVALAWYAANLSKRVPSGSRRVGGSFVM